MPKRNMVKGASKKATKMAVKYAAAKANIALWQVWAWVIGIIAVILLIVVIFGTIITAIKIEEDKQKEQASGDSDGCSVNVGNIDTEKATEKWKAADGTPLEGKAGDMIKIAKKEDIDPAIFMAIVANETGYGTAEAVKTHNNVAGMMGSGDLFHFDSIDKGLDAAAKNLNELYFSKGLTTPEKIGKKYAPVGAENDPTDLNSNWVPNVKKFTSEISKSDGKSSDKGKETVSCDSDVPAGKSIEKLEKVIKKNGGKLPKTKHKTFQPNTYNYRECTWYVYNRRKELGLPVTLTFGNGGDWAKKAKAQGYKTGKEPKVGAMVSWPYNSEDFGSTVYGHIAFVEEVKKNGEIRVSEHNIKPFAYGERTFKPKKDLTFIY